MRNSKQAIESSKAISVGQMIVGVFFLFIFGLSTVACLRVPKISNNPAVGRAFFVICLIFDVLGVMLIIFSIKRIKRIKKFAQETNCIIIGSGTNNQQRAARPVMQANTAQPQSNTAQPQSNTTQSQSTPRSQRIQVICECCGGINKIEKGIESECDFCGSPING